MHEGKSRVDCCESRAARQNGIAPSLSWRSGEGASQPDAADPIVAQRRQGPSASRQVPNELRVHRSEYSTKQGVPQALMLSSTTSDHEVVATRLGLAAFRPGLFTTTSWSCTEQSPSAGNNL
mmetsp:Transcript_24341/g.76066  ORF Transcript_24341/g.76066 Transcript_24341/m.76066 type:complete len:122 (+) Transcript_24341:150-515(+)